jgi:hypothetical protein
MSNKAPQEKVAILRIPASQWHDMTPQQQMLYIMQQTLGFMASEFFADMDGMRIQVIDTDAISNCKVVFQVGKPPRETPLVQLNS